MDDKLKEANAKAIGVEDISSQLYPLLSTDIVNAYKNNIVTFTTAEYDEIQDDGTTIRKEGKVRCIGVKCKTVEVGIPLLAEKINKGYAKYKYIGTLGSISYELPKLVQNDNFLVLSYFLLSKEDYTKFDSDINIKEK